ncbi:hypothetical protein [Microbulbifer sp. ZKSA002]|uniref:hypothetical protein n=1 Tax=Microbulbifer sp. ZKSA002 TaxID=3243388 RepID=UPI0040390301
MMHRNGQKTGFLAQLVMPALVTGALLTALASPSAEAFGRFGGGGAHFNIGGHFNGMRPMGGGFHGGYAPGEFARRFPNHPPFRPHRPPYPPPPWRPHYWPYPGPAFWGTAAAVGVGGWLYTLPRSCVAVTVGNVTYEHCGSYWYEPHFVGGHIAYRPVRPPR